MFVVSSFDSKSTNAATKTVAAHSTRFRDDCHMDETKKKAAAGTSAATSSQTSADDDIICLDTDGRFLFDQFTPVHICELYNSMHL